MIYISWDIEQNKLKLVALGHFFPLYRPKNRYHHFTHVHQKSQSYYVRFLRCGVRQTKKKFHFGPFFVLLLPPLMILNIKILKKMEILPFYTYICTISEDHMICDSWNIRCDRQKFLILWAIFCPFSPLTTWKIKV